MMRWSMLFLVGLSLTWGCVQLLGADQDYVVGEVGGSTGTSTAGAGAVATGGSTPTGGAGGEAPVCVDPSDCGQDTTCQQFTCNGTCGVEYAASGTPCTEDSGTVCNGNGACVPVGCADGSQGQEETDVDCGGPDCPPCENGSKCEESADCASGFCPAQDGLVCCDSACDGTCRACTSAHTGVADGTCSFILPGQDPDGECPAADESCDGTGQCGSCGVDPTPPGGTCPGVCTGGCNGGTCTITCVDSNSCFGATINCPAGFACDLQCTGNSSCEDAIVTCPDTYACSVTCPVIQACKNVTLNCSSGSCSMDCQDANQVCEGTTIHCGPNACTATCGGSSAPTVDCGTSCRCTSC